MTPNLLPRTTPRRRPIAFATLAALLFVLPVAAGCSKNSSSEAPAAGSDPVIARVNGVGYHAERSRARRGGHGRRYAGSLAGGQARAPDLLSRRHHHGHPGRRQEEARRHSRVQATAGVPAQQAADGVRAAGRSQGRAHRRGLAPDLQRRREVRWAARRRCTRATSWSRTRTRRRRSSSSSRAAPISPTLAKEKSEGSGRGRGRRPRLLHQGPDGAGIRRCRVQDVSGAAVEPGEDAVRLAHHQGRGQAHQAAAGVREGEGPDRGLPGTQGADRLHHQAAPDGARSSASTSRPIKNPPNRNLPSRKRIDRFSLERSASGSSGLAGEPG